MNGEILSQPHAAGTMAQQPLFEALPGVSPSVYGEKDFLAMAQMMRAEAGIMLPPGKAILVYSRLAPLVRASNLGTFAAYIVMIGKNAEERRKAVCALTTNHTFFYREAHHFDHFTQEVRPQLVEALDAGEAVRMWSAGCSSGEEVFSLAMAMLGPDRSEGRRLARLDLRILGSDIADPPLIRAREGGTICAMWCICPCPCAPHGRRPMPPICRSAPNCARSCSSSGSTCMRTGRCGAAFR
jgi:chemotaxis protein methyltransferase CheR